MKPGLIPGAEISFVVTVTPDMYPAFDGIVIHEVMSTVSMIYYMEKAGREMIVPFWKKKRKDRGSLSILSMWDRPSPGRR